MAVSERLLKPEATRSRFKSARTSDASSMHFPPPLPLPTGSARQSGGSKVRHTAEPQRKTAENLDPAAASPEQHAPRRRNPSLRPRGSIMVKIAFNSALAHKPLSKEAAAADKDPEVASVPVVAEGSTGRCLLTLLGIAFILSGLIVGAACLYRYFTPKRLYHGAMQFSDVLTPEESQPYYLPRVEEEVEISDNMAVISVPPPRFRPGDPAYILHDFHRKLTAYLDLTLRTCFVIPLNTSVVLPPQDLIDLFSQLMSDSYRSYLVHEDLVVTERIDDVKPLGFYIRRLCDGKETYRMQRRSSLPGGGIEKRSAEDCFTIHHFENKFVTETRICKA